AANAHPARGKSHQDALRPGRRLRTYLGRSRAIVCGHPRTYSPDRSQGPAQAPPSFAFAQVARVYGRNPGSLTTKHCKGANQRLIRFDLQSAKRRGESRASFWDLKGANFPGLRPVRVQKLAGAGKK